MSAIEHCRTAALGGHVEACEDCGHVRIAYNSCRNRHCPKCQGAAARTWLAEREADLLPVGYFHVVFTLPAEVADIAFQNKAIVYDLLFRAASETMMTIAADPKHLGARIGITAVLHTPRQECRSRAALDIPGEIRHSDARCTKASKGRGALKKMRRVGLLSLPPPCVPGCFQERVWGIAPASHGVLQFVAIGRRSQKGRRTGGPSEPVARVPRDGTAERSSATSDPAPFRNNKLTPNPGFGKGGPDMIRRDDA